MVWFSLLQEIHMFHFQIMVCAYQFDTQKLSNVISVYYDFVNYAQSEPFVICGHLLQI